MQALFLDACGVLYYRPRRYRHLLAFLQGHGLPTPTPDELQAIRARTKPPAASREAKYDAFLAALGVNDPPLRTEGRRVLVQEAAEIALFPAVADTLRILKGRGFKLGVITNTATPGREKRQWLAHSGIDVDFDCFVASCDAGVEKPHPRIYQLALAECGVHPGESLFVGHAASELDGARRVGLRTVAFAPPGELAADDSIGSFDALLALPYLQMPSRPLESSRVGSR